MNRELFSHKLEQWLGSNNPKTLASLVETFGEKSFGVSFILLLFVPALPLPTGGVTHIFEIIAMLLSLEMILGRQTIWLPKRWLNKDITFLEKLLPKIINTVNWVEKHSRPRLKELIQSRLFIRLTGLILLIFCLTAFLAPPFSGLDTLPSLAVVLLGLALIFDDMLVYFSAILVGVAGIGLIINLGAALINSFRWI